MGFTRKLEPGIRLSPREEQLVTALRKGGWQRSDALCKHVWGHPDGWPLNARKMVRGAMAGLQLKLEFSKSKIKVARRGNGGRGGIEYRLE